MFLTHTNSVYAEDITLLSHVPRPQYVHQVSDGGLVVDRGIKVMAAELVDYILRGKHGAAPGTTEFIKSLLHTSSCKVGLILAAGGNVWSGHLPNIARTEKYPTYKVLPMSLTQVYAGYLANRLGAFEYIATDSTSCISGHSAWYTARNMLALGLLDAVVVVATDNGISEEYLEVFGGHGLSKSYDEEGDSSVTKFRLGQGCNISVFERGPLLSKTGHDPLARITDMYVAAETYTNPLGISCRGSGYAKVMDTVNTHEIDFVKTHSTFSSDNQIEEELIKKRFGDIRTINYKLRIGHTMGASTAVETALAIQEETGKFLSLGAGMGNVFSAAVVEIMK